MWRNIALVGLAGAVWAIYNIASTTEDTVATMDYIALALSLIGCLGGAWKWFTTE
jgi:hypothetical protein